MTTASRIDEEAEVAYLAFCRGLGVPATEWSAVPKKRRDAWKRVAMALYDFHLTERATDTKGDTR